MDTWLLPHNKTTPHPGDEATILGKHCHPIPGRWQVMVLTRGVGTIDVVMTGSGPGRGGHLTDVPAEAVRPSRSLRVSGGFRTLAHRVVPTMVGAAMTTSKCLPSPQQSAEMVRTRCLSRRTAGDVRGVIRPPRS